MPDGQPFAFSHQDNTMTIHELHSPAEAVDAAGVALSAFGPSAVPMS